MIGDLPIELVAEHNDVFELGRQRSLIRRFPAVPDLGFTHEVEPAPLDHCGLSAKAVRAKEDGRPEDALKRTDQPTVLLATRVHAETRQHFSGGPESDRLALLLDRQSRQKYRNQAVLPKRHAKLGVARDLKQEPAVPPLLKELVFRQAQNRQSTQDERS